MLANGYRDRALAIRQTVYAAIAVAFALALLAPAVGATSLVAQLTTEDEVEVEGEAAPEVHVRPSLSRDQILFMEQNWHFSDGSILVEEESAPQVAPEVPALDRDQMRFLEDNWYFSAGDLFLLEDVETNNVQDAAQIRDDIQFKEDNWYYSAAEVEGNDRSADQSHKPMTRYESQFLEENLYLGNSGDGDSDETDSPPISICCGDVREFNY
jgi:hypothetical protein